jgi:hypothetical protein
MKRPVATALMVVLSLSLAGCGGVRESRFNPFNWFSRSAPGPATLEPEGGYANTGDFRALVDEVTAMAVTRIPGGAIVNATGLPPTQAWWDAELVAENDGKPVDGVLTYRFVIAEPRGKARVSTPQSREVTAGKYLSDIALRDVSRIVVQGARNSRSSRR